MEGVSGHRAQFAFQHGGENPLPSLLLSGHRLLWVQPLFQAQPRGRLGKAQEAAAIREFNQEQFDAALQRCISASESIFRQHLVERVRRSGTQASVSRLRRLLEFALIKLKHPIRRLPRDI